MADKVLLTELYPKIVSAFSDKKKVNQLETICSDFIDRNSEKLSTQGPTKMILFTDKDTKAVYDLMGVDEKFIIGLKNKSKDIKSGFTMGYSFNLVMPMIIRYFSSINNKSLTNMCISHLATSMYPMLFYKYFKYEPNENIMNYTINNLSNKYKIKQTGNLYVAICETAYGAYNLHTKDLARGYDIDVVDFILSMRTRLNSFFKKIANEFYINQKEGNYLNTEFESNEEDNYREADSSVYAIERIVNKTALKLVVDGPSIKLINIAAKYNQVSVNELKNYINTMIISDNTTEIKKVIESILFIFIFDGHNKIEDVNSDKFLIHCLDIYKRSNTTDKNVMEIKRILDKWLERCGTYKKTERLATINNFRRALYTFFVISIQYSNVN